MPLPSESTSLAELTTLRLGGRAQRVTRCDGADELVAAVGAADDAGTRVLLLGGGSNVVISDDGFAGSVVVTGGNRYDVSREHDGVIVTVDAGMTWDDVVKRTVDDGFGGIECLSGIPGSAGATPIQNVGAYGVEVGSVLHSVELYDRATRSRRNVSPDELRLGYRTSVLKGSDAQVVVSVSVRLTDDGLSAPVGYAELARRLGVEVGERVPVQQAREAVLVLRSGKGMVLDDADHDTWSAGSFFTNPVVPTADVERVMARITQVVGDVPIPQFAAEGGVKLSAGWLIERAGFTRGFPGDDAPVRLSTKHTLALTNRGQARTSELLDLARQVRDGVAASFGIELHPEPVFVNCSL